MPKRLHILRGALLLALCAANWPAKAQEATPEARQIQACLNSQDWRCAFETFTGSIEIAEDGLPACLSDLTLGCGYEIFNSYTLASFVAQSEGAVAWAALGLTGQETLQPMQGWISAQGARDPFFTTLRYLGCEASGDQGCATQAAEDMLQTLAGIEGADRDVDLSIVADAEGLYGAPLTVLDQMAQARDGVLGTATGK